jgi:hypothetical protein
MGTAFAFDVSHGKETRIRSSGKAPGSMEGTIAVALSVP